MFLKGCITIIIGFGLLIGGGLAGVAWLVFCFGSVIIGILLLLFLPALLFLPFQVSLFGIVMIRNGCDLLTFSHVKNKSFNRYTYNNANMGEISADNLLHDAAISMFRPLIKHNNEITDKTILEIIHSVVTGFRVIAVSRGENISSNSLIKITSKFIVVYDLSGQEMFLKHLKYELQLYKENGLRKDYL